MLVFSNVFLELLCRTGEPVGEVVVGATSGVDDVELVGVDFGAGIGSEGRVLAS